MKIVLLGSLPKGDSVRSEWVDWKQEYVSAIKKLLPDAEFIHGDSISDNAGTELVVGHDLSQVKRADICVVDARHKIGAGTAQEMVIAKFLHKPVVSVVPPGTHHRKSNVVFHGVLMDEWIHPFIKISSDYVAESIDDAASWIKSFKDRRIKVKGMEVYENAINKFEEYEKTRIDKKSI